MEKYKSSDDGKVRDGVAKDAAFCFYYKENLEHGDLQQKRFPKIFPV